MTETLATRCLGHPESPAATVRWLLKRQAEPGVALYVEQGLCASCLNYLADGKLHRRKTDNTLWKLMPPSFRPETASGPERDSPVASEPQVPPRSPAPHGRGTYKDLGTPIDTPFPRGGAGKRKEI